MTQAQIKHDIAFWEGRLAEVKKTASKAYIELTLARLRRHLALMGETV